MHIRNLGLSNISLTKYFLIIPLAEVSQKCIVLMRKASTSKGS